ncbi:hypothetical protein H7H80_08085, partial [Mycobacterium interjectum]|nr:hypothetical protein [Mycobacterium interjectum]
NYVVQVVSPEDEDRELLESFDLTYGEDEGGEEDLQTRPPVVTCRSTTPCRASRSIPTPSPCAIDGEVWPEQPATELPMTQRYFLF